jgi:hypothetical protein
MNPTGCTNQTKEKTMKPGDKVTYIPTGEKGIVKRITENSTQLFVVFGSCINLENYENYTAQSTELSDLKKGWKS